MEETYIHKPFIRHVIIIIRANAVSTIEVPRESILHDITEGHAINTIRKDGMTIERPR